MGEAAGERDGWRRAYVVARDGSDIKPITPAGSVTVPVFTVRALRSTVSGESAPKHAIASNKNAIASLTKTLTDDRQLIDEIFMRILNRHATDKEVAAAKDSMQRMAEGKFDFYDFLDQMKMIQKLVMLKLR